MKKLITSKEDFNTLLDEMFKKGEFFKPTFESKEIQREYQMQQQKYPTKYPIVIIYDYLQSSISSYGSNYGLEYYRPKIYEYITMEDFGRCSCGKTSEKLACECCYDCDCEKHK